MKELKEIYPELIYVTLPVEYIYVYRRILRLLADYGVDVIKDCKSTCVDRNRSVIECFNMFNCAVACRKLGKDKEAALIIKYVDAKIDQLSKGKSKEKQFSFPVEDTGKYNVLVTDDVNPKFEIDDDTFDYLCKLNKVKDLNIEGIKKFEYSHHHGSHTVIPVFTADTENIIDKEQCKFQVEINKYLINKVDNIDIPGLYEQLKQYVDGRIPNIHIENYFTKEQAKEIFATKEELAEKVEEVYYVELITTNGQTTLKTSREECAEIYDKLIANPNSTVVLKYNDAVYKPLKKYKKVERYTYYVFLYAWDDRCFCELRLSKLSEYATSGGYFEIFNSLAPDFNVGKGLQKTLDENGKDVLNLTLDTAIFKVVNSLPLRPEEGDENKIHLVKAGSTEIQPIDAIGQNVFDEFLYVNNAWELIGKFQPGVDLSNYVTFDNIASGNKNGVVEPFIREKVLNQFITHLNSCTADKDTVTINYQALGGGNTTTPQDPVSPLKIPFATEESAGVMTAEDKKKLNSLSGNNNNNESFSCMQAIAILDITHKGNYIYNAELKNLGLEQAYSPNIDISIGGLPDPSLDFNVKFSGGFEDVRLRDGIFNIEAYITKKDSSSNLKGTYIYNIGVSEAAGSNHSYDSKRFHLNFYIGAIAEEETLYGNRYIKRNNLTSFIASEAFDIRVIIYAQMTNYNTIVVSEYNEESN